LALAIVRGTLVPRISRILSLDIGLELRRLDKKLSPKNVEKLPSKLRHS